MWQADQKKKSSFVDHFLFSEQKPPREIPTQTSSTGEGSSNPEGSERSAENDFAFGFFTGAHSTTEPSGEGS